MERYHTILADEGYRQLLRELEVSEKERIFCRHSLAHFCDVARIMYILALEEGSALSQDVIYATALLHDIGRVQEYRDGTPHEEAGVILARPYLEKAGYEPDEIAEILQAIQEHRTEQEGQELADYLYRADKLSRMCFACDAAAECKWSQEKRNHTVTI